MPLNLIVSPQNEPSVSSGIREEDGKTSWEPTAVDVPRSSCAEKLFRLASFLPLILALCGCATFRHAEGLDVTIVNLQFTQATVLETTAIFTVRLENENPNPVMFTGGVHKFYLNGFFVGKGLVSDTAEVPRFSSVTQPVTVHLRNFSVAARLKSIIEAQTVEYRVSSVLYRQQGDRTIRSRLSSEGQLSLRDFRPGLTPAR